MTTLRQIGNQSPDQEFNERLATEESLDLIKKLLAKARKVSKGGAQNGLAVTSSPAVRLNVPQGATHAEIYVRTAPVVFSRDGTVPTATKGIQAEATDLIVLVSSDELAKFGVIAVSASATVDVEFFAFESA